MCLCVCVWSVCCVGIVGSVVQLLGKCLLSLPIHRSTDDDFCRCASGVWSLYVVGVGGGEEGGLLCEGSLGMCAGLRLEC